MEPEVRLQSQLQQHLDMLEDALQTPVSGKMHAAGQHAALQRFVPGLQALAEDLQQTLDDTALPDGAAASQLSATPAAVRQLLDYAHRLAYTTFAPPGHTTGQPLPPNWRPPAPQDWQMRASQLHSFSGEWEQRQQQKRAGLLTVQAGGVKEGARSLLGGLPQTAPPPTGQPAPVGVLSEAEAEQIWADFQKEHGSSLPLTRDEVLAMAREAAQAAGTASVPAAAAAAPASKLAGTPAQEATPLARVEFAPEPEPAAPLPVVQKPFKPVGPQPVLQRASVFDVELNPEGKAVDEEFSSDEDDEEI